MRLHFVNGGWPWLTQKLFSKNKYLDYLHLLQNPVIGFVFIEASGFEGMLINRFFSVLANLFL
jgi:hypothetical protein